MASPFVLSMMITGDSRSAVAAMTDAAVATTNLGRAGADAATQSAVLTKGLSEVETVAKSARDAVSGNATVVDALRAKFDPLAASARTYAESMLDANAAHAAGVISGERLLAVQVELTAAYNRTANQMDAQAAAAKRAAEQYVGMQTITPDRGADIEAYGRSLDALRGKFNPLYAAGEAYKQMLEDIAQAERVGAISADEAVAARNRATVAYRRQNEEIAKADREAAGEAGINRTQRMMLFSSVKHGFESYVSGAPASTIVSQQLPEILDAGQMGGGGVAGMLGAVGKMINPATVGLGALAVAIGVATKAWWDYDAAQRELTISAAGVGRSVGATVDQLNAISARAAAAGNISVSSARGLENQLLRTGKVGLSSFEGIIAISKDFGATVGLDADKAGEALTSIFADPAKGAQTLYQQYNLIDGQTVRQVQRLVDQNHLYEAQQLLLDKMPGALVKSNEALSYTAEKWESIAKWASDTYNSLGGILSRMGNMPGMTAKEQSDFLATTSPEAILSAAEAEKEKKANPPARSDTSVYDFLNGTGRPPEKTADFAAGIANRSAATSATRNFQDLVNQRNGLKEGLDSGKLVGEDATNAAMTYDAVNRAIETYITEQQQANKLAEVDAQIAAARDPLTRANLEAKRQEIQLNGQVIGTAAAQAKIDEARTRSLQMSMAQSTVQLQTLNDEVGIRRRVNDAVAAGTMSQADANRETQLRLELLPLERAAEGQKGAELEKTLSLIRGITEATRAQGEEEKRAQAQQAIRSGSDQLETTRAEISLLGQSEAYRNRELALLKANQQIRQMGLNLSTEEGSRQAANIRQLAVANADASTQLSRMKDAYGELNSAEERSIDTVVNGALQGKDVFASLAQDIQTTAVKLAITNPIKNALLGTNYGTIADLGAKPGTIANSLAQSVGTATINAATVIINGGVGAGTGVASALGMSGANSNGIVDRSAFAGELSDPSVRNRLFAMTEAEVGGQGPQAQQAFMESVFNRAQSRGQTLSQTLSGSYFPQQTYDRASALAGSPALGAKYSGLLGQVSGGSNVANFATGNASGTVGFGALGYQTTSYGGEKFGVEQADLGWANQQRSAAAALDQFASKTGSASTNLSSLTGATDKATSATTTLGTNFTDLSKNVLSTDAPAMSSLQGGAGAAGGIGGMFNGLVSAIGSVMSSITSAIGGLVSSIGGGLGSGFGSIFSAIFGGAHASGGKLVGPGSGTSDSFLIAASNGEYVVNAAATAQHLPLLEAINDNKLPRYASGSFVGNRASLPAANSNSPSAMPQPIFQTNVINNTSAQVTTRETDDGRGGRRQEIMIDEMVGSALSRQGGASQKALKQTFGVGTRVARR